MKNLYAWQKQAIAVARSAGHLMLNVCCGGGKSLAAALIAKEKDAPCIIIAPKALCDQWRRELEGIGVAPEDIFVHDQPTYSKNPAVYERGMQAWLSS